MTMISPTVSVSEADDAKPYLVVNCYLTGLSIHVIRYKIKYQEFCIKSFTTYVLVQYSAYILCSKTILKYLQFNLPLTLTKYLTKSKLQF